MSRSLYLYFICCYGFFKYSIQHDQRVSTFSFSTNRVFGHTVPQTLSIETLYKLNYSDNVADEHDSVIIRNPISTDLRNLFGGPYVCTSGIDKKIVEASSVKTYERLKEKLEKLKNSTSSIEPQEPIIDVSHGCRLLEIKSGTINSYSTGQGNLKRTIEEIFRVQHTFERFDTILFVDAYNVAAFHYLPSHHDGANPQGYKINNPVSCDITTGEQIPFRLSDRPSCPNPEESKTSSVRGVLKTYVPNKIVETHRAYQCYIVEQALYSSINAIWVTDWRLLGARTIGVNESTCREWIKTKTCQVWNRSPRKCGEGYQSFTMKPFSGSTKEFATTNSLYFQCYPNFKFCGYHEWVYYVYNCHIKVGEIAAFPPLFRLSSTFGAIPSSHLRETSYKTRDGLTVIWDKFYPTDLCMWTMKSSANARKIAYDTKNTLKEDRNPNVDEVVMFVADKIHQAVMTDNTLRVSATELNCVSPSVKNYEIYTNVDASELYVFLHGSRLNESHGVQYGIQTAHERIVVRTTGKNVTTVHHSTTFRSTPSKNDPHPSHIRHARDVGNETEVPDIQQQQEETFDNLTKQIVSLEDTLNYVEFKQGELDERRLEQRALQQCYNSQFAHDTFVTMMNIDPSRTLSNRLKMTVIADNIGNGFYSYRTCEDVEIVRVIEDLFTTSEQTFVLNSLRTQEEEEKKKSRKVSDHISSKGVVVDPRKCLSQPLVIFRNRITRVESIGQLMPNNHINTKSVPFLEHCDGRHNRKLFHIYDTVYEYFRYKLIGKQLFSIDNKAPNRITTSSSTTTTTTTEESDRDLLADVQILTVTPHRVKETPIEKIMTGLVGHTMYNMHESQSSLMTLNRIMEYVIANEESNKRYTEQSLPEEPVVFGWDASFGDIMHEIGEGVGEGVTGLATGLVKGADGLVKETGHLAHDVVETAGGVLGDIGSALTGPLMKILLPIAIALAIGLAVYLLIRYLMSNRDDKSDKSVVVTTASPQQSCEDLN